jgi:hypothetical protein
MMPPGVPLLSPHLAPLDGAVRPTKGARRRIRGTPHDVVLDVVLVEAQERSSVVAPAVRRRVSRHGSELEMDHVVPMNEHLLQGGPERLLAMAQPLMTVRRTKRSPLQEPLARATGGIGRVGHRDHASAIFLRRTDRLGLFFTRVDERQHRHVVRGSHTRDELVQPPLGAKLRRARQERRDEQNREPLPGQARYISQRGRACRVIPGRAGIRAETHRALRPLRRRVVHSVTPRPARRAA